MCAPCTQPLSHVSRGACCELIHTARTCLRQHLRFPPMFNLAERGGRLITRACSLGVTGLDTLSGAYTQTHTSFWCVWCMSQYRHTHLCLQFCHIHVQSFMLPDQMLPVPHKHTLQLYIHPAVPYVILDASIACDSFFDALWAHFLRLHVSYSALLSGEVWLQRQPLSLEIIAYYEILRCDDVASFTAVVF